MEQNKITEIFQTLLTVSNTNLHYAIQAFTAQQQILLQNAANALMEMAKNQPIQEPNLDQK